MGSGTDGREDELRSTHGGASDRLQWNDWGQPAFDRARREDRPLLLSISAAWSAWGERMDAAAFSDPRVVRLLTDRFVPVRVDADERLDVQSRYATGELPAVAFLTPDGDVVATEGYLDPEELLRAADAVLHRWTAERETLAQQVEAERATRAAERAASRATRGPGALTPAFLDVALEVLAARWTDDPPGLLEDSSASAASSVAVRRPHPSALRLWRYAYHRRGMAGEFNRAFDLAREMVEGGLLDTQAGGIFHFAPTTDARVPRPHKTAREQGELLLAFAELALSDEEARDALAEGVELTAAFVIELMGSPTGAVYHSVRSPDAPDAPEALDAEAGEAASAPRVTASAAAVARGLLAAGTAYDRRDWVERGRRIIDFLLSRLAAGEAGMYHAWEGGSPRFLGLLDDQAQALLGLLECYEVSGQPLYFEHARRLARVMERDWYEPSLGFRDLSFDHEEVGLLAEPAFPLAANVAAAEAFLWLGRLTHDPRFMTTAQESLVPFAHGLEGRGLVVADYARVVDRLLSAEPEFKIVAEYPAGEPDAVADPLHRAALRLPLAGRTVQRLDRSHEQGLMYQLGLPDVAKVAYVCTGPQCSSPLTDPEQLLPAVEELLAAPSW